MIKRLDTLQNLAITMPKPEPLKSKIFIPLGLLLTFLTVFTWYQLYSFQEKVIDVSAKLKPKNIKQLFEMELEEEPVLGSP